VHLFASESRNLARMVKAKYPRPRLGHHPIDPREKRVSISIILTFAQLWIAMGNTLRDVGVRARPGSRQVDDERMDSARRRHEASSVGWAFDHLEQSAQV
jgi:hypothetical protein